MDYKKTACAACVALLSRTAWADSYLQSEFVAWRQIEAATQQNGISLYGAVDMGFNSSPYTELDTCGNDGGIKK